MVELIEHEKIIIEKNIDIINKVLDNYKQLQYNKLVVNGISDEDILETQRKIKAVTEISSQFSYINSTSDDKDNI